MKNIAPGKHHVKIVKKKRRRNGNGFVRTLVYNGNINIPSRRKVNVKVEGRNRLSFRFFRKGGTYDGFKRRLGAKVYILVSTASHSV